MYRACRSSWSMLSIPQLSAHGREKRGTLPPPHLAHQLLIPAASRNRKRTHLCAGMGVQTIGEAYQAGWRIHVRRAWGRRELMTSVKPELDLHTLIWTTGGGFPLSTLENRLKCPLCGPRNVAVIFEVPRELGMRIAGNAERLLMRPLWTCLMPSSVAESSAP